MKVFSLSSILALATSSTGPGFVPKTVNLIGVSAILASLLTATAASGSADAHFPTKVCYMFDHSLYIFTPTMLSHLSTPLFCISHYSFAAEPLRASSLTFLTSFPLAILLHQVVLDAPLTLPLPHPTPALQLDQVKPIVQAMVILLLYPTPLMVTLMSGIHATTEFPCTKLGKVAKTMPQMCMFIMIVAQVHFVFLSNQSGPEGYFKMVPG